MTLPEEITTAAAEEMDLTQYLPGLDGLQSSLATWMKVLVIIGPIVMLLLGLYYYFLSPKEANFSAGYRFRYAMSRVGVWRFTQKLAGIAYGGLGLILSIVMLCLMSGFSDMSAPDLVWRAFKCLLWQIILALVAMLAVDVIVVIRYNFNGKPRRRKTKGKAGKTTEAKPTAPPAKQPTPKPATAPAKRPTAKPTGTPARRSAPTPTRRPTNKPTTPKPPASSGSNTFHRPDDLG